MNDDRTKKAPVHCLAIILCKDIIEDKYSNNKTLVNTFNNICTEQFPFVYHKLCVFCSITEVIKNAEVVLVLKKSDAVEEMVNVKAEISSSDPLAVLDIVFILNNIVLPEYGTYSVELLSEGCYLTSRRFTVTPFPAEIK